MQLSDYIGREIAIRCPVISDLPARVKLLNVEAGGIWIEYPPFLHFPIKVIGQKTVPKSPVLFVPFHELRYVYEPND
jgi:hypothetical protein